MWQGARLLTPQTYSGDGKLKGYIAGLLHGLLLGLAAADDMGAQSVEVY